MADGERRFRTDQARWTGAAFWASIGAIGLAGLAMAPGWATLGSVVVSAVMVVRSLRGATVGVNADRVELRGFVTTRRYEVSQIEDAEAVPARPGLGTAGHHFLRLRLADGEVVDFKAFNAPLRHAGSPVDAAVRRINESIRSGRAPGPPSSTSP